MTNKTAASKKNPATWEDRHVRRTFYVDRELLDGAKAHAKGRGESLSALISRSLGELLERESK